MRGGTGRGGAARRRSSVWVQPGHGGRPGTPELGAWRGRGFARPSGLPDCGTGNFRCSKPPAVAVCCTAWGPLLAALHRPGPAAGKQTPQSWGSAELPRARGVPGPALVAPAHYGSTARRRRKALGQRTAAAGGPHPRESRGCNVTSADSRQGVKAERAGASSPRL